MVCRLPPKVCVPAQPVVAATSAAPTTCDAGAVPTWPRPSSRLSRSGAPARVTCGSHGYGAVRVAWTDGTRSSLLLTTVMKTDTGPSGAPLADMIAMAGSIPASL